MDASSRPFPGHAGLHSGRDLRSSINDPNPSLTVPGQVFQDSYVIVHLRIPDLPAEPPCSHCPICPRHMARLRLAQEAGAARDVSDAWRELQVWCGVAAVT